MSNSHTGSPIQVSGSRSLWIAPVLIALTLALAAAIAGGSVGYRFGIAAGQTIISILLVLPLFFLWKYLASRGKATNWNRSIQYLSVCTLLTWIALFAIVKPALPLLLPELKVGQPDRRDGSILVPKSRHQVLASQTCPANVRGRTLKEVRQQSPQYADYSDAEVSDALAQLCYPDQSRDELHRVLGLWP